MRRKRLWGWVYVLVPFVLLYNYVPLIYFVYFYICQSFLLSSLAFPVLVILSSLSCR